MKILQFTRKSLAYICIAIFTIIAQFSVLLASYSNYSYAYTNTVTEDKLTNSTFEQSSSTSTGKPNSPSYWTAAGGDEASVSKGVIDTSNETFNTNNKYGLTANPLVSTSVTDKKVLMIDSKGINARFGYKNTTEITLNANRYYRITVLCKTQTVTNGASIYLTGTDIPVTNQYNFIDVVTGTSTSPDNGWKTYTFYVKTDITKSSSVSIELWLGSKQENNVLSNGQVFFDNIKIQSIDQTTYHDNTATYNFNDINNMPASIRKIDLTGTEYANQFQNGNFENSTLTGWERTATSGKENVYSGLTIASNSSEMLGDMHLDSSNEIPGNNYSYENTQALYINHNDNKDAYTQYTSEPITIKQHSFALITYYSKTGNITQGGAFATVKTTSTEEGAPTLSIDSYTTKTTGIDEYNKYALTTIYVEGNPYRDVEITLTLGLGTKDATADGYVIFDDIKVYEISYETYSSATSNKLALYKDSDTTTITNGAFNFSGSQTIDTAYPIAPRSWTVSNDVSGIININKTLYDAQDFGSSAVYPGPVPYKNADQNPQTTVNNMLMLRSVSVNKYVTATSTTFSVEAGASLSSITVYVKVQANLSNPNSGAYITLLNGNNIVAQIPNITTSEWTAYTIYFKNTSTALSLQLQLSLGNEENPTSGYAYFDYISYKTNVEDSELTERNKATTVYTNLENNNFDSYIAKQSGVNLPTTMTAAAENSSTTAGVININTISSNIVSIDVPTRTNSNNNLLMIKNNAPTSFTYKTNYSYTFATDTYYAINVWIYTANLVGADSEQEEYGVNISLSNVKNTFENVRAKVEDDETVWTKYSFYVSVSDSDSVTSSLSITFGSEEHPVQGFLFVDTIEVDSSLDLETYNNVEEDEYTIKTVAKVEAPKTEGEEDADTSTTPVNYWILLSSLIIALALIIAIIGMAMRHVKFRLPRYNRNKKSDYNRDLGLNNADVKKELQAIRTQKVKKLDEQIESTKQAMAEAKTAYEESIKDEKSEQKIEKLFKKYASNNGKLQREIDNLESAKKYITDPNNIKLEEDKEIRRRQLLLEEENALIKQNQAAIEKEKLKEKQLQQEKIEEGKKKARLKNKQ